MIQESKKRGKILSKKEVIALLNRTAQMRAIREKELNCLDPTVKGGITVTVLTPYKGRPSEVYRRSGRTGLEQHAVYRWNSKTPYWGIQEKIALNRR